MKTYTIAEDFVLPSKGKIYSQEVNPNIKLASMTTYHEMQRLNHSENQYKNMCDIIDDCLVEGPGISSYDLCLGDYLFLLHRLRVVTYGPQYNMETSCPYCGHFEKFTVNLDDVPVKTYTAETFNEILKYKKVTLPVSNKEVTLKFQTPHILDKSARDAKEYKERYNIDYNVDLMFIIKNSIDLIDGEKPDPYSFESWVKNLPMQDTNLIISSIAKLNNLIGLDLSMECLCEVCGLTFNTMFNMGVEFFRPAPDFGR